MLDDLLAQYDVSMYPMHMPGHKRNTKLLGDSLPYHLDITEIDGFDDLYDAHGVLRETMALASSLYGSRSAFLLVNGSTGGLLAAISAAVRYGDTIILARNCHKSAYHAVEINGLKPVYLMPETDAQPGITGSVKPCQVEAALEAHPDARLVIVTSPTYEGVVSDIAGIAEAAHARGVPVLVDEAHGAHLGFSEALPKEALTCGADLVVMSLHKTLPALTQSALFHLGNTELIDEDRLKHALSIFQTSSPSYVLMASIDRCVRILSANASKLFEQHEKNLRAFSQKMAALKNLTVLCHGLDTLTSHPAFYDFDPGKLVILSGTSGFTGLELADRLRSDFQIETEMASRSYAVAMTSVCDDEAGFDRLASALLSLDGQPQKSAKRTRDTAFPTPCQLLTPAEAMRLDGVNKTPEEAVGSVSLEYIWAYPPGIPLVVPGEELDAASIETFRELDAAGIHLRSTRGRFPEALYCAAPSDKKARPAPPRD